MRSSSSITWLAHLSLLLMTFVWRQMFFFPGTCLHLQRNSLIGIMLQRQSWKLSLITPAFDQIAENNLCLQYVNPIC